MGIPRLTTFMNQKLQRLEGREIQGRIIIDGHSIMYFLYYHRRIDWTHGGQYREYWSMIHKFIGAMKASKIIPIVVMDGAQVMIGEKLQQKLQRGEDRLKTVNNEKRNSNNDERILPPLALQVFLMTLQELEVEVIFADGEGDFTVYRLANYYSCPVLSNDSDFYIFNLHGFIPYSKLEWEECIPVKAQVYNHAQFFSGLGVHDPNLRLIIPAIVGNDFISPIEDGNFITYMARGSHLNPKDKKMKIDIIVNFIKKYSSWEDFMAGSFRCSSKDSLLKNCRAAAEMYNTDTTLSLEEMKGSTSIHLDRFPENLPRWLLNLYRSGNFLTMNILISKQNILKVFVEDTYKSTCTEASKPIRQFMYGLLGLPEVTEYKREGVSLKETVVKPSTELEDGNEIPKFESITAISKKERAHILYSMLGCSDSEPEFERLDNKWCLAIAATKFWIKVCQPTRPIVEALLLCFAVLTTNKKELSISVQDDFQMSQQWMELMHTFSSWQSCYGDAFRLNQILGMPLTPVSPACLYDGRLLIYLARKGGVINLYKTLLDAACPLPTAL